MKTFRAHYLLALILFLTLLSAAIPGTVGSPRPDPQHYIPVLDALQTDVIDHLGHWDDSNWQAELRTRLATHNIDAVLQNPSGVEVFRTQKTVAPLPYRRIVLVEDKQITGTMSLYIAGLEGDQWLNSMAPLLIVVNQLALFILLSWLVNRYLLKPLSAMSRAARQIATGDLAFDLPPTYVRELADVATAFEVMRNGLRESVEQQAKMEQERRFFISAIAHDLRTPLFSLRGYLEGLRTGIATTPDKTNHYLTMCKLKADILERLIADLFAFTRLEFLEQMPQSEVLELCTLLRQAVEGIRPLAEEKHITLQFYAAENPASVRADRILILRVIGNLLDNAVRYTAVQGNISVGYEVMEDKVTFFIADDGAGIAQQDMSHLFEPFYRGEPSRNATTGGSGLGLAIAQRIMQAHHGNLTVSNQAASGAKFTAWFPRA
ncbi:MAG: HAMP domain-containing sensor histidine kinase [Chloroflexota bacterium]